MHLALELVPTVRRLHILFVRIGGCGEQRVSFAYVMMPSWERLTVLISGKSLVHASDGLRDQGSLSGHLEARWPNPLAGLLSSVSSTALEDARVSRASDCVMKKWVLRLSRRRRCTTALEQIQRLRGLPLVCADWLWRALIVDWYSARKPVCQSCNG